MTRLSFVGCPGQNKVIAVANTYTTLVYSIFIRGATQGITDRRPCAGRPPRRRLEARA